MNRTLWLILSLTAAAAVFMALAWLEAAVLTQLGAAVADGAAGGAGRFVAVLDALAVAAAVGFVLGFVGPALADAVVTGRALTRLRGVQAEEDGRGAERLRDAVRHAPFLRRAVARYLAVLGLAGEQPRMAPRPSLAPVPADRFLGAEPLVERRLGTRLFRTCPVFVAGLGVAALAAVAAESGVAGGPGVAAAGASAAFLTASLLLALVMMGAYAALAAWRMAQAQALCDLVEPGLLGSRADPVGDAVAVTRIDLREIKDTIDAAAARLDHALAVRLDGLAQAIAQVLAGPLGQVADGATLLAEDQRERLAETMSLALSRFAADLDARHGTQTEQLNEVLGVLADNTHRLDVQVGAAADRLVAVLDGAVRLLTEAAPAAGNGAGTVSDAAARDVSDAADAPGHRREGRGHAVAAGEAGDLDRLTRELLDLKDEARSLSAELPLPGDRNDDRSR